MVWIIMIIHIAPCRSYCFCDVMQNRFHFGRLLHCFRTSDTRTENYRS